MAGYNSDGIWEDDGDSGEYKAAYNQRITEMEESSRVDSMGQYDSLVMSDKFMAELLGNTGIDPEDLGLSGSNYSNEGRVGTSNFGSPTAGNTSGQSLMQSIGGFVKDNKELVNMGLAGVASAFKDKSAREMSQAQLDAIKQRQTDLNNSVRSYTKDYRTKA